MRCLLINPSCPISEGPTPPLGISFLAAVLQREGIETKILDLTVFPYSPRLIQSILKDFEPAIVGITAVTMTFNGAIKVIEDIKNINSDILTVMGGPHVSFRAVETLTEYPSLDLVVIGEGEETIVEIAREFNSGKNWSEIKGLAYRSDQDILVNQKREYLDVNSLPLPARDLLPLGRYRALHTAISMTTSRGCPFKCIFCIGRQMVGARVRYRDPIAVVDELEMLSKLDFPQINISDDLFTAKSSHCIAICDEILKRNLNIKWSSFARVDTVSLDLLKKMKEAGCTAISFGVETADPMILKTIKKGITLDKVKNAIQLCTSAGILPHVSFILGLPGESPESLAKTRSFGQEIAALGGVYGFHLLAPFPGTAVRDNNSSYDLKILSDDWDDYHANRAIVETSTVSKEDLDAIAEEWDSETKKLLYEIKNKIEQGTATKEEEWQLINLDRFLFIYQLMMDEILEKYGSWEVEGKEMNDKDIIQKFAERIHPQMNQSFEKTVEILQYAFERNCFLISQQNNDISIHWKDYLSTVN